MTCNPPPVIGTMLCSRDPEPGRPAPLPSAGCFQFETDYQGNVGNDMGMPTVGYRAGRYNYPEWHEATYSKYYQSFADRDNAERVRNASDDVLKEIGAMCRLTQEETVKRLGERLKDLHFWKGELEREMNDMVAETDDLLSTKKRLERAMFANDVALLIITDNMNCRETREGLDKCQDDVELNLIKECEVVSNSISLLKKTIREAEQQLRLNRDRKAELEQDWSDKLESDQIDTFNVELRREHTRKQFHAGVVKFPAVQSTSESWAQCCHDNVTRAEHERMASIQFRTLSDNILHDTSRDIREQADNVENAFERRIREMEDCKSKLVENLHKTVEDIASTENMISRIKNTMKAMENDVKVCHTRLYLREKRPGVDQCRDPVQYHLVGEGHELTRSLDSLQQKLNESEHSLKDLQDQRMVIEKDIVIKTKSLFIDREKCMAHRTRYPTNCRLLGYD